MFGSSVPEENSADYVTAYECGRMLAEAGMAVCNGGYAGTMEASAKGAKEAGGTTIGITVSGWSRKPNLWIQQEIKAQSLIERLMKLVEKGNAYVVLPGGTGTLLEFACVLELINKDIIGRKPIVLIGDFWNGILETLRNEPGSQVRNDCTRLVRKVGSPVELLDYLKTTLLSP
jgi:uncharacterized protein (TIGR00725 family)